MNRRRFALAGSVLAGAVSLLVAGCSGDSSTTGTAGIGGTVFGPAQKASLFAPDTALARTYVTLGSDGKPVEVGLKLNQAFMDNFMKFENPLQNFNAVDIPFPSQAPPPFNHVNVLWGPNGHPLPGVFTVSHFDFHFYYISGADRSQIGTVDPAQPDPRAVPPDYVNSGVLTPHEGTHYFDLTEEEFGPPPGHLFSKTMVYGYYNGKMITLEPQFAVPYLNTHPNVTVQLKQPQIYPKVGYYPTQLTLSYDPVSTDYTIALQNLVYRTAIS